mmetsp:Transcript_8763/g.17495  ORF Transcript_8763/g.17495 Transcript_8763/m.17495 type:complete len:279 (+) Transcript_8763:66-902(+)|eukprot:CAMPEP_0181313618 /NCGR_PEP_ID=MMETSP1101-20121128/14346_1 /TAXON_ID=46948 /ORGANISM="Rhodomonas abbreviata, Strain Caron Lab Isolate" /LENGTH=278 /DNA_ID=CAMNT_0023420587 /DNA_START=66 /DNA_END=902 /DNA_ORIENTATION=+
MSFPVFKDLDKDVVDMIEDDFDSKFTLKIKSAGPCKSTITTNVQFVDKDGKTSLKPKVSVKWPHPSGFTLDKLEFSPDCRMTVETSLTNALPGLKFDFKGNDAEKADLSFKYNLQDMATITGDFDINSLSRAETTITHGHGAFLAGVSAKFATAKDDSKTATKMTLGAGLSHTVDNVCFTALRAKDNFSNFSLLFSYTQMANIDLAGSINHCAAKTDATLATAYKVDASTTFKAKATTEGVISASVKKAFEKKFAVTGSVEVPTSMKSIKWGLNATLG